MFSVGMDGFLAVLPRHQISPPGSLQVIRHAYHGCGFWMLLHVQRSPQPDHVMRLTIDSSPGGTLDNRNDMNGITRSTINDD